jgi:signal peptidase I
MTTIVLLTAALLVNLVLCALVLWGITRLFGVERATFFKAGLTVLVMAFAHAAAALALPALPKPSAMAGAIFLLLGELGVGLSLTWAIIAFAYHLRAGKSALVGGCYLLGAAVLAVGLYFGLTQLVRAFTIPSNSMAPTLIGHHFHATCPHCQGTAIVPARRLWGDEPPGPPEEPANGICTNCLKIAEYRDFQKTMYGPDRFICNNFLQPGRWDLIVFRYPLAPEHRYVMRLVGLPGETIQIKEKAVWINGVRLEAPARIRGLDYLPRPVMDPLNPQDESAEWVLGSEDYFVLGEFTTNASDSREWGPVPRQNIVAVAEVIYWPPERWRLLR